jgi:dTDP-4-dehydrorhamnose reductase
LAHEVAARLGIVGRIDRVLVADVATIAPRPRFCALSNQKLRDVGIPMPDWKSTIERHVTARLAQSVAADDLEMMR